MYLSSYALWCSICHTQMINHGLRKYLRKTTKHPENIVSQLGIYELLHKHFIPVKLTEYVSFTYLFYVYLFSISTYLFTRR